MIPIRLTLQGVYSYQQKVDIDFDRLLQDRLFGIFGPVGSGKSAILESICYALYGKVDRLDSNGRNYNLMNLRSDTLLIEFEFAIHKEGERKKYRYKVTGRRNSRNFADVPTLKRSAYVWDSIGDQPKEWLPLESANAEQVLGLSYEHFSKTVIIPQGKFQEFIHMRPGDRATMLQELFELNKFDLYGPANRLLNQTKEEYDLKSGELKGYDEVTSEAIREQAEKLSLFEEKEQKLSAEYEHKKKELDHLTEIQSTQKDLLEIAETLEYLESLEKDYQQREQELGRYLTADRYFNEKIQQHHRSSTALATEQGQAKRLSEVLLEKTREQEELVPRFETARTAYENRQEWIEKAQEMTWIAEAIELENEIKQQRPRLAKADEAIQQEQAAREQALTNEQNLQTALEELKTKRLPAQLLAEIGNWFAKNENLHEEQAKLTQKVRSQQLAVEELARKAPQSPESAPQGRSTSEAIAQAESAIQAVPDLIQALDQHILAEKTRAQLAEFAGQLAPGAPCPLCGATDHPAPLEVAHQSELLHQLQEEKNQLIQRKADWERFLVEARVFLNDQNVASQQLGLLQQDRQTNQVALLQHRESFVWEEFSADNPQQFKERQEQQQTLEKNIQQREQELQQARTAARQAQENLERYQTAIQDIRNQILKNEAGIDTRAGQLRHFDFQKHQGKAASEVTAKADFFREKVESVTQEFTSLKEKREQLLDEIGKLNTDQKVALANTERLEKELQQLNQDFEGLLQKHQFAHLQEVKTVLAREIDTQEEEEAIRDFKENLSNTRHQHNSTQEKLKGVEFDQEAFENLTELVKVQKQQREELLGEIGGTKASLEKLRHQFEHKKVLAQTVRELELRKDNLKTLSRLFHGKGFVKYISSIYLHELCQRANQRFLLLTRNQLSLEIQGENEFAIRDMLNGGKVRSIKTLSGGQTFQASLCLALALSENIQARTPGNNNFFFLDEGFGTLDRESLRVVFDTLKQLRREQRSVGIISHVEELQQEIGIYLRIRKDDEQGSQAQGSWQA